MDSFEKALLIVDTLKKAGYISYFAGGWVRDFLLHHPSDDIDIATNASPEIIQKLFPKTLPIGIAFGIILVVLDGKQFEVATFRKDFDYKDGRHPSHVEFSDIKEDAKRRDFTINGMFYDPLKKEVLDFVEGQKDLKNKLLRAIGDPYERFHEDRLRMIRAIRFACRFDFTIEATTKKAIQENAKTLFPFVAIERVWQELYKMSIYNHFEKALFMLYEYNLLQTIFPTLEISKNSLTQKLELLKYYPEKAPLIAKILELFPATMSQEETEVLCKYLKLSHTDLTFSLFLQETKKVSEKNLTDLLHFYANPLSSLCLQIESLHKEDPAKFLTSHEEKKEHFLPFIQRIQHKNPLIKSSDLKNLGIVPGKLMGILLKKAETISIEKQTEDPDIVLEELKKTPLWPKS